MTTRPSSAPSLRQLFPHDDLERLTVLVQSAYASHAAKGLRYWATHQTVENTAKRLASGLALVMEIDGDYAATATLRAPQPESKVALYRDSTVWSITQFCVAPRFKGQGLGKLLHGELVRRARNAGAASLALDTAQPAYALIAMYESWGYRVVGECDWRPLTNYTSVLMSRPVGTAAT
ncbi:MAG: GNAT family N-acetyltransferase [Acidovorax sp.]|uniref:GNAT family N-acetyltransferase n=1 Tax=Acidovorax sp. TaxID=1872122 RepID=UPI00391ACD9D